MIIETLTVGPLATNCYVVGTAASGRDRTREAMIIDPGGDTHEILLCLHRNGLTPKLMVNTHAHADHMAAVPELKEAHPDLQYLLHGEDFALLRDPDRNLSSFVGAELELPEPDRLLAHGDVVELGEIRFRVIHVPGHTPGGICLYSEDTPDRVPVLFSGDALFAQGIGRTDLPGGDHAQLIGALRDKILTLDERCVVYPGHGPITTIGDEKAHNPFL